jgi:hypothetical protein
MWLLGLAGLYYQACLRHVRLQDISIADAEEEVLRCCRPAAPVTFD